MRSLTRYVYANLGGERRVFAPGDSPDPDWAEVITNPAVWSDEVATDPEPTPPDPEEPSPAPAGKVPARAGRGSSRESWLQYAQDHGVDVAADASRDDIIAACETAGLIHPEA